MASDAAAGPASLASSTRRIARSTAMACLRCSTTARLPDTAERPSSMASTTAIA